MDQLDFNSQEFREKMRRKRKRLFLIFGSVAIGYVLFNTGLLNIEFDPVWFKRFATLLLVSQNHAQEIDKNYIMPDKESGRFDILVLGLRGENTPDAEETGAFLTDTVMVFSHDQITKKSSLVSIPRDFYVRVGSEKKKINEA